jgi:hypothetical protein
MPHQITDKRASAITVTRLLEAASTSEHECDVIQIAGARRTRVTAPAAA